MSPLERAVVASKLQHLRELVNLLRNEAIDPRRVHAAMGIALVDLDALIVELADKVAI